ncbi:MAG TPA: hypothetical protein PLE43_08220 [Alphaproteobacteria bacterium]|nr:hypothetical protein [Alphaproteobacteria bacterium]
MSNSNNNGSKDENKTQPQRVEIKENSLAGITSMKPAKSGDGTGSSSDKGGSDKK